VRPQQTWPDVRPQRGRQCRAPRTRCQTFMKSKYGTLIIRVVDPDSVTLWIRIRIGNPDPGAKQ
jgi:hypothetical protein